MKYRIIDMGENNLIVKIERNKKWENLIVTEVFDYRNRESILCLESDFTIGPKYMLIFHDIKYAKEAIRFYKKSFVANIGDDISEEDDI